MIQGIIIALLIILLILDVYMHQFIAQFKQRKWWNWIPLGSLVDYMFIRKL